jgi:predicted ATPase
MEPSTRPCLKITGLHVEGLKALRRVDWPADGLGWRGQVPDMVMVGGINGSGKTTLLEFLWAMCAALTFSVGHLPVELDVNAWIDLALSSSTTGAAKIRVVMGDSSFIDRFETADSLPLPRHGSNYVPVPVGMTMNEIVKLLPSDSIFTASDIPGVIYLPTDRRLSIPGQTYKAPGKLSAVDQFVYRFTSPSEWRESLEALLYSARWADLNAKEEGHPERATHFDSYAQAFQGFFGDHKHLVWEGGELFVKIADTGALHPLMELSSGEKQALILAAELYRRWRPGSLILIDEPELHFHSSWQTRLWLMLAKWQKERGGQVIVATQSTHLFGVAEPGTTVLLGKGLA